MKNIFFLFFFGSLLFVFRIENIVYQTPAEPALYKNITASDPIFIHCVQDTATLSREYDTFYEKKRSFICYKYLRFA